MKKIITTIASLLLLATTTFGQLSVEPHIHGIVTFISESGELKTGYVTEYDDYSELYIIAISNSETEYEYITEDKMVKFSESIADNVAYTFSNITVIEYDTKKVIVKNVKEQYNLKQLPIGRYMVITDEYQLTYTKI